MVTSGCSDWCDRAPAGDLGFGGCEVGSGDGRSLQPAGALHVVGDVGKSDLHRGPSDADLRTIRPIGPFWRAKTCSTTARTWTWRCSRERSLPAQIASSWSQKYAQNRAKKTRGAFFGGLKCQIAYPPKKSAKDGFFGPVCSRINSIVNFARTECWAPAGPIGWRQIEACA